MDGDLPDLRRVHSDKVVASLYHTWQDGERHAGFKSTFHLISRPCSELMALKLQACSDHVTRVRFVNDLVVVHLGMRSMRKASLGLLV